MLRLRHSLDGLRLMLPLHPLHRLWLSVRWFVAAVLAVGTMMLVLGIAMLNPPPQTSYDICSSWLSIKWDIRCVDVLPTDREWISIADEHNLPQDRWEDLVSRNLEQPDTRRLAEDIVRDRMLRGVGEKATLYRRVAHGVTIVAAPVGLLASLVSLLVTLIRMRWEEDLVLLISDRHVEMGGQRFAIDELEACVPLRQRLVLFPRGLEPVSSPRLSVEPDELIGVCRQISERLSRDAPRQHEALHQALSPVRLR